MITRVTQNMLSQRSLAGVQTSLAALSRTTEQLSSGKRLTRPSDAPTDVSSALRLRASLAQTEQYSRNASDGLAWMGLTDTALQSVGDQVRRARELALQGASTGTMSAAAREALAVEVDQIRAGVVSTANTTYLGRPVFGGVTAGGQAYDAAGTYVGVDAPVDRAVADGVTVRADTSGPAVFGPAGSSLFDDLTAVAAALRTGDSATIRDGLAKLEVAAGRVTSAQADLGTRTNRIERARAAADDAVVTMTGTLGGLENVDPTETAMQLKTQEVAYQAALAATARVVQPSLVDFLR